jgi:hypothetical protein
MSKRQGFWIKTGNGVAHVLGDRDMPDEALEAIRAVIKAAKEMPIASLWSIEWWHQNQWSPIVQGSEKQMRSQLEKFTGEYRLLNPDGVEISRVSNGGGQSK